MCQIFNATSYIIIPADLSGRAILYFNNAGRLQIWRLNGEQQPSTLKNIYDKFSTT